MFYSVNTIFRDDQSYLKQKQLTDKELKVIRKIAPEIDTDWVVAYKSVGNFLSSKTYIFTCNAVYVKNVKISFLGLLDIVKKGNSYNFVYVDRTQNYNIDSEVYEYIKKILDVKKSIIQKADNFVYGNNKNIEQALYNYTETMIYDRFGPNDRNSLNNIGYYYWQKGNYAHALAYYQVVEKLGDWAACFNMALIYHYGYDVEKDYTKALNYYKQAERLNPKNIQIKLQLGWLYKERKEYMRMFDLFIEYGKNNTEIENQLGLAFWQGLGVRKKLTEAYIYIKKAASKDPQYYYNLAALCKDMGKAHEFYKYACKAEKAKHPSSDTLLGIAYKEGIGVQEDSSRAEKYLLRAVSLNGNNPSTLYNLAELYKDSFGYIDQAYELYKKAADLNHPASCIELAKMYLSGRHVNVDKNIAAAYVNKAAEIKNIDKRLIVAQMYIDGDALPQNRKHAFKLIDEVVVETQNRDAKLFYFQKILNREIKPGPMTVFEIGEIYSTDYRISDEEYNRIQEIVVEESADALKEVARNFENLIKQSE